MTQVGRPPGDIASAPKPPATVRSYGEAPGPRLAAPGLPPSESHGPATTAPSPPDPDGLTHPNPDAPISEHPSNPASLHQQQSVSGKFADMGSWLKDYGTALKHGSLKPFTITERKARAATRNKPWGPIGAQLNELAELTFNPVDCGSVFKVLELRMAYPPHKWRNVYKSLSVLEFLLKRGSDDAVARSRAFLPRLQYLESFAYITPDSRDVGANVRHRAKAIKSLLEDEKRLADERRAGSAQRARMASGHGGGGWAAAPPIGMSPNGSMIPGEEVNGDGETSTDEEEGALPNAGETKGISPEANARHLVALKQLLARSENALCADCAIPGPGHRPTWASISLGVFMCMRCAGVHRGLGVHVSQVRSCSLDTWRPEQVEFMAGCGGNRRANAYWEARLDPKKRPPVQSLADLDGFIRKKYIDKAYADEAGGWPPEPRFEDAETRRILEEMLPEEEKAARVTAREAAEAAEAEARAAEEAAARAVAEETELAAKAAASSQAAAHADLINLLDFEDEPVPNVVEPSTLAPNPLGNPFAALETVFTDPAAAAAQKPKDPLFVSQPPPSFDTWDMGGMLAATHKAEKAKESEAAATAAARAAEEQRKKEEAQRTMAYHPPWAPAPLRPAQFPEGAPLAITAGPAAAFHDGFTAVPHQFTSTPVLAPEPLPAQLGWNTASAIKPAEPGISRTNGSGITSLQSSRPLQPHELRAQQLMLGGLDSFSAHANLVTVKTPTGGMKAMSPSLKNLKSTSPQQ